MHTEWPTRAHPGPRPRIVLTSIWGELTVSKHENHEIYHEAKPILQSYSALMIITKMPITQDLSLIPKLGLF